MSWLSRAISERIVRLRRPESRSILVIGVGGAGSNAVDRMREERLRGVALVTCNTDAQALRRSRAPKKVRIGRTTTGGLGSGGDPEVGRRAAEEDGERLDRAVEGADLAFIVAGLGGGTGSGAGPIVAAKAKDRGALTIGVVTKPFEIEGGNRRRIADDAEREFLAHVDALIAIPNDRMSDVVRDDVTMIDAFRVVDGVVLEAVRALVSLIDTPGLINLDFADVRSVLHDAGPALIGLGAGSGENRATDAARAAISSPLFEARVDGAKAILFHLTGPADLQLREMRLAADEIRATTDADASMIFGASVDRPAAEDVRVVVIATGLRPRPAATRATRPAPRHDRGAPAQARRRSPAPRAASDAEAVSASGPRRKGAGASPPPASLPDDDHYEVPSFLRSGRTPPGPGGA